MEYCGAFMQQLLEWKSSKYCTFWVCVCSLRYRACDSLSPCYVVFGLSACTIFSTARISKDMLLNIKCVFGFSLQRLS